jgi:hypothetical protein
MGKEKECSFGGGDGGNELVLVVMMEADLVVVVVMVAVLVVKMVTENVRRTQNSKGLDTKNQQLDQQCNQKFNNQELSRTARLNLFWGIFVLFYFWDLWTIGNVKYGYNLSPKNLALITT